MLLIGQSFLEKITLKRMYVILSMSFRLEDGYFDEEVNNNRLGYTQQEESAEKVITSDLDNMLERMLTFFIFFLCLFIFIRFRSTDGEALTLPRKRWKETKR